jgi:hypothetical protein
MMLTEIRRVLRGLCQARGFTVAVIVTLALGIGANTAMFTLLRGSLLRPLPNARWASCFRWKAACARRTC